MSAGAISGASGVSQSVNKFSDLSSSDFVKIMITELTNQDPFEPQDSAALLAQLSSLRNIESELSLQNKLESVQGVDANNNSIAGEGVSSRVENKKTMLELSTGQLLGMDRVTRITDKLAG